MLMQKQFRSILYCVFCLDSWMIAVNAQLVVIVDFSIKKQHKFIGFIFISFKIIKTEGTIAMEVSDKLLHRVIVLSKINLTIIFEPYCRKMVLAWIENFSQNICSRPVPPLKLSAKKIINKKLSIIYKSWLN